MRGRLPHIVALRLYWQPPGVPPFEPDGEEQQKRLDRLIGLHFYAVDDLEILARIAGTKHTADPEGAGRRDVLFVDSEDAVYHDYPEHEADALLPALAPALATAFATTHYEDAFARVLAARDAEADALCLEKGIDAQQLEEAEDVLRSRGAEAESRRVRIGEAFLDADVPERFVERVLVEPDWNRNIESGALLATLEDAGVDLEALDTALKDRGLERIDLGAHARLFVRKRRLLVRLLTPLLVHRGAATDDVGKELTSILVPDTGYRVAVPLAELLTPLIEWMQRKGLDQLKDALLAGTLDRADVAEVLGLSLNELDAVEAHTWSAQQRAMMLEQARQRVVDAVVLDCVTAWLEQEGAHPLPSRVRTLRDTYRSQVGDASVSAVDDAGLADSLAGRLEGDIQRGPLTAIVEARVTGQPPPEAIVPRALLSDVLAALARDVRKRADRVRESMQEKLEEKTPAPPKSAPATKAPTKGRSGRKKVGGKFGGPSERERKRRGDRGERIVLGLQVKRLEGLDQEDRQRALAAIDEALRSSFEGPAVDERAPALAVASDPDATEDERIDALATYLDVAAWPGFGFDLLGWDEAVDRPLFIEVKTTRTANRFVWSEPERKRALEEQGEKQRYRIALLHRKTVTWLTDPLRQVRLEERDWTATVVVEPKA